MEVGLGADMYVQVWVTCQDRLNPCFNGSRSSPLAFGF